MKTEQDDNDQAEQAQGENGAASGAGQANNAAVADETQQGDAAETQQGDDGETEQDDGNQNGNDGALAGAGNTAQQADETQQGDDGGARDGEDAQAATGDAGQNNQDQAGTGDAALLMTPLDQKLAVAEFAKSVHPTLLAKIEAIAEHTYLDAQGEIDALAEEVERLADEAGMVISKLCAKAIAAGALLWHKVENADHIALVPKAANG